MLVGEEMMEREVYLLNGPELIHPPPFPGGMQFSPVGRALVQL